MLLFVTRIACCLAMLTALAGCLLEESLPPIDPNPPATCGDGVCQIESETCTSCAQDCDCCSVVNGTGVSSDAGIGFLAPVVGNPDNQSIPIDENSDLQLAVGGEWFDQEVIGLRDFTVHGVVSTNDTLYEELCVGETQGAGGFEIWVSEAGSNWRLIGLWTSKTNEFDIACAQVKTIRWVRIKGQPGARGSLDAVTAKGAACLK
jgi:hypothetical protein